jgi:uncharacterized membrane protein
LAAIVVAAAGLRAWGLGAQSLWYDEWSSLQAASASNPADLVRYVAIHEGSPPGYFLVLWVWQAVLGSGEVALRSLSLLAGVATVPLAYAIAVELGQPRRTARIAALLVAVHPALVWYSQEARPYSLLSCVGAVSVWAYARILRRDDRAGLVLWAAANACLVAVHWFGAFLVVAELGALLLLRPDSWRSVLLATVPVGVMAAALVPIALEQHSHGTNRRWITGFSVRSRLGEAGRSALAGPGSPDTRWWAVVLVALAVGLVLGFRGDATVRRAAGLAGGVGAAAALLPVVLALSGVQDALVSRYLIASVVPLCVAAAVGLGTTAPRWVGPGVLGVVTVVALASVSAVARDPALQKPDWQAVADVVREGPGERLLLLNYHQVLGSPLRHYLPEAEPLEGSAVSHAREIDVLVAKASDKPCNLLVGQACALIFLGGSLPQPLAGHVTLIERVELDQFVVERYRVDDTVSGISEADLVPPSRTSSSLVLVAGS